MNKQECVNELNSFVEEIQALLNFLQKPKLSIEEKHQLQSMFKTFKERLKQSYKERDKVNAYKTMSDLEQNFVSPAIQEAFANLSIKTNSVPNENWVYELLDAQDHINYYLDQLKDIK